VMEVVYTKIWKESHRDPEAPRIIKGSVAGGLETADSDAKSRNRLSSDSASR